MTGDEKQQVRLMRQQGVGYARIAASLGISPNTVKSFCRRNKLQSRAVMEDDTGVCQKCGKRLHQDPKHKTRRFCSDHCRLAWWNSNRDKLNRKAVYRLTCVYCGKEFESYGSKRRKYCTHTCYIKDRFGEEGQA